MPYSDFAYMTPTELTKLAADFRADLPNSEVALLIKDILALCEEELGWWGTSDYTGVVPIEDLLSVVRSAVVRGAWEDEQ